MLSKKRQPDRYTDICRAILYFQRPFSTFPTHFLHSHVLSLSTISENSINRFVFAVPSIASTRILAAS